MPYLAKVVKEKVCKSANLSLFTLLLDVSVIAQIAM